MLTSVTRSHEINKKPDLWKQTKEEAEKLTESCVTEKLLDLFI